VKCPALDLAEAIGLDLYTWINDAFGFVLGGGRLFAGLAFDGPTPTPDDAYFREVLQHADPDPTPGP
jgi:hypothetical protein